MDPRRQLGMRDKAHGTEAGEQGPVPAAPLPVTSGLARETKKHLERNRAALIGFVNKNYLGVVAAAGWVMGLGGVWRGGFIPHKSSCTPVACGILIPEQRKTRPLRSRNCRQKREGKIVRKRAFSSRDGSFLPLSHPSWKTGIDSK